MKFWWTLRALIAQQSTMSAVVNTFFQLVRQPAIATDQLFFHLLLQCERHNKSRGFLIPTTVRLKYLNMVKFKRTPLRVTKSILQLNSRIC